MFPSLTGQRHDRQAGFVPHGMGSGPVTVSVTKVQVDLESRSPQDRGEHSVSLQSCFALLYKLRRSGIRSADPVSSATLRVETGRRQQPARPSVCILTETCSCGGRLIRMAKSSFRADGAHLKVTGAAYLRLQVQEPANEKCHLNSGGNKRTHKSHDEQRNSGLHTSNTDSDSMCSVSSFGPSNTCFWSEFDVIPSGPSSHKSV
jgi:hypothetical protein